jgi:hypothetical protein
LAGAVLAATGLTVEQLSVRVHPAVEPTTVVRLGAGD